MFADEAGKLYVFGGKTVSIFPRQVNSVEMLNTTNCSVANLAPLPHGSLYKQVCLDLKDDHRALVCGGESPNGNTVLQLYNYKHRTTSHIIELPFSDAGNALGAVLTKGHVVVVFKTQTVVLSLEDVLSGRHQNAKVCGNYVAPNKAGALITDSDGDRVLLLGGKPKEGMPRCYAYQASVEDVVKDSLTGWRPAHIPWTLGEYLFTGGYDIADIKVEALKEAKSKTLKWFISGT